LTLISVFNIVYFTLKNFLGSKLYGARRGSIVVNLSSSPTSTMLLTTRNHEKRERKERTPRTTSSSHHTPPVFDRLACPDSFTGVYRRRMTATEEEGIGAMNSFTNQRMS
jgi:hypothetical protein